MTVTQASRVYSLTTIYTAEELAERIGEQWDMLMEFLRDDDIDTQARRNLKNRIEALGNDVYPDINEQLG